ncbi:DCC-interacting protein 13-alpha isoform X2 [Anser cygnoides]|uniref:DCC-interacting protein 13-alpha isoform X2 n=1 Tax=Anser cygnoides TaxID=8845 RepID=UPI0034D1A0C1
MTESHLLVTCDCLKLINPQTQVTRLRVCDSVGLAKQIAFHEELDRKASEKAKEIVKDKQQKELSKQKQIKKDLEEQSRLIAASSRSNPHGGEGQFVVLRSSQSEDSNLGEDGKKKRESET